MYLLLNIKRNWKITLTSKKDKEIRGNQRGDRKIIKVGV